MATHRKRLRPVSPWGNTYFLVEHSCCLLLGCPASWYNGAISLWPCQTSIHGCHSSAITLLWKHHSAWESSLKTLLHWKNTHFFIKFRTFETNSLFVPRISRMRWGRGRGQLVDITWLMARVLLLFSQVNPQTSAHPSKTHSPFPTPLPYSVHTTATVPIALCWEFLFRCQLHLSDRKLPEEAMTYSSLFFQPLGQVRAHNGLMILPPPPTLSWPLPPLQ